MKINIKLFAVFSFGVIIFFSGCKRGDDYYISPNDPQTVTPALFITATEVSTFNTYESDLVRRASIYMQQNAGVEGQALQINTYTIAELDFVNTWAQCYQALFSCKQLNDQFGAANPYYSGMANILAVMNWGILTDMWGNIPFSDALNGSGNNYMSKYDSQEDVYKGMQALLDTAIIKLSKPSSANNFLPAADDLLFKGDTVDVKDLEKNYQDEFGKQNNLTTDKSGNNPYWILNKNLNGNKLNRFYGSNYLEYKPVEWLTVSDNFGYDIYNENRLEYVRQGTAGDVLGSYYSASFFQKRFNNDLIVTAQKNLNDDWNLKAMVGNNILNRINSSLQTTGSNLFQDSLFRPGNAETVQSLETYSQSRLISLYGELSAAYKNMLYLTVTGRNDWSSALVYTGNNSYFYPSITSAFVFSELLQNKKILSFGKVRASYAQVGSDTDPYTTLSYFSPLTSYFVQYSLPGQFPFNGQGGFSAPRTFPNKTLKPQLAGSFEVGADLRFFNERISVDFTYYNTKTKNQIINLDVPLSTGYFAKQINAGQITNRGIEVVLRLKPLKATARDGFNWDILANFSHNKQIVDELDGVLRYYAVQSGWSGLQIKAPVGGSFALYGSQFRRSPDGQFVINRNTGLRETDNDKRLGDVNPTYLLGITNQFSYKGFSLGFLVDIRQGGVFYSGTVASLRSSGMAQETTTYRDGIFIDKGVNLLPDGTYQANVTPVQSMQDFWGKYSAVATTEGSVFDASYVKLREVTLSYAFPPNYIPFKNVIKDLQIGFEARNLWLIKSFVPHVDPELSYFGNGSAGDGVEFNSFPSSKTYGINLKVKF